MKNWDDQKRERIFNGKVYELYGTAKTLAEARNDQRLIRENHNLARITKIKHGYAIWVW